MWVGGWVGVCVQSAHVLQQGTKAKSVTKLFAMERSPSGLTSCGNFLGGQLQLQCMQLTVEENALFFKEERRKNAHLPLYGP